MNTLPELLRRLWRHISPRRRGQLALLLVLMLLASFAEILSIGAVLPFLSVLTAPDRVFEHDLAQPLIQVLGVTEPKQLLLPLTILFVFAAVLAGAMRLLLLWANIRLSFAIGADLGISVYRRTLFQPYTVHVRRNSSEVITGISEKTDGVIVSVIEPVLNLTSSSIMLLVILLALIAIDPVIALGALGGFALIYILIIRLTRRHLTVNSRRIAHESTQVYKALQEGLGGIRDVLIDGTQATYCRIFRNADLPLRRAQGDNEFIAQSPRFGIEALGMVLIATLAYLLARQPGGIGTAIPILGTLALGAQRLLPVMQRAYAGWSAMRGGQASLQDALDLLDQELPEYADRPPPKPLRFERHIRLNQISFQYAPDGPAVLRDIDVVIPKGSRIGIMGATGSGKSTLLDIIMGLLPAAEGELEVDGSPVTFANHRAWQAHIAHVPQSIFLADTTVEENIALGIPGDQIDPVRVRKAARQAQIAESIEAWPGQYRTVVGERGIRLSGGQRQRIGIARALYKRADVIILDEATSALDNETEQAVMRAVSDLDEALTIFIVAHRLTTLKNCDRVIELREGRIVRAGSYDQVVGAVA